MRRMDDDGNAYLDCAMKYSVPKHEVTKRLYTMSLGNMKQPDVDDC